MIKIIFDDVHSNEHHAVPILEELIQYLIPNTKVTTLLLPENNYKDIISTALNDTSLDWIFSFSNSLEVVDLLQNEAKTLIIPAVQFYVGFWEYDPLDKGIIRQYVSNKTICEPLQFELSIMIDTILQHAAENELISVMFLANASSLESFINEVVTMSNKKDNIQWVAITAVEGVFYYNLCAICSAYFSKKIKVNGSSSLTGKYRKHAIREIPEIIREYNLLDKSGYFIPYAQKHIFQNSRAQLITIKKAGVWSVLKEIQPYTEIDLTKESVEENHYRVGFIKEDPFIVEYQNDGGSYKLGGYCIDVVEAIAEYLNFTYEYVDYTNEEFGSINELGRWSGLAGDLQRGIFICNRHNPYSVTNNKAKYLNDSQHCEFTLKHSFWYCLATMTPQAVTWWLFGFIVLASYTANLAAFFTVSQSDFSIKTIEDLGKQTKLKYTLVNNSFSERFFLRMMEIEQRFYSISDNLNSNISMSPLQRIAYAVWDYPTEDFYTQMYRSMSEHIVQTFAEGVELVLRSKSIHDGYVFIANESPLKMLEMRDCRLQIIGEPFNERPLSFAARRHSPVIDKLNTGLLHLVKERKTEILKDKWWNRHPNRTFCQYEVVKAGVISMENIGF
ncbi:Glutamate receptor ionotropic, kainate 2 [Trichinella pseudospiralis]|uniref:Glutamate receptor ionotropic, kainate 2 n=1 Tax=Trichinella pseudospiralis TaxID=6337 RepID=A0A0V1ERE2_TRIPS|nr:Glutamate receptor ionotropic, kainate 2 [Trichinella pseudospiralis]KRZ20675.1 Glutamate receptor ionotropic, kainate 2 [Trichinella pseudospiralis]KRZ41439.1 Glutamate receptor ionotropic, kainate 2 [Trichinella pseudospiralis]